MPIGRGRNVFEIILGVIGEGESLKAIQQMATGLKNVGREAGRAKKQGSELGRSFRNIFLRTAAYIGVVRSIRAVTNALTGAINAGIEYNATIEQSRLAIATLIAAQGDLVNAQGEVLTGAEELDAAYSLAVDQVQKLRIAGIQTAATTTELVDAFQQAVGAGLATGLTLDEIRTVTIRIAQAAGALGVPYRQLNEEIRSILGGIIDQNTRIAKSLQITNDQVRLAKEQNRLAEFLLEKFEAFGVAGERIVNTWAALKSNIQEAFELLAGEVTFPAFEKVRKAGLEALAQIFDFDTAEISADLRELVTSLQQFAGGIGELLAGAIQRSVDGMINLNQWIQENQEEAVILVDTFVDLFRAISQGIVNTTAAWIKYSNRVGALQQTIETLGDTFRLLARDSLAQVVAILAGVAAALGLINALLGPVAAGIAAVSAALFALSTYLDYVNDTAAETVNRLNALEQARFRTIIAEESGVLSAIRLVDAYDKLQAVIDNLNATEEQRTAALERQQEIRAAILAQNPRWIEGIKEAEAAGKSLNEAVDEQIKLDLELRQAEFEKNKAIIKASEQQIAFSKKRLEILSENRKVRDQQLALIEEEEKRVRDLTEVNREFQRQIVEYQELLAGEIPTLRGPEGESDPAEAFKAMEAEINVRNARIKTALAELTQRIKIALEENLLSYQQYYELLNAAQDGAYQAMIRNEQELLAAADDPKKRAQIEQRIIQLQSQARLASLQTAFDERRTREEQARKILEINERIARATGQTAEATVAKLRSEFEDFLVDLEKQGDQAGIDLIEELIDIESARAQFKDLESIVSAAQQRLQERLSRIDLEVETQGITKDEGRLKTIQAYRDLRDEIGGVLPALEALSTRIQNPQDRQAIQEIINLFEELGLTIADLEDEWKKFRLEIEGAATEILARHLSDAVTEAESLGDALENLVLSADGLRNMLGQLAQAIVEVTARMIAQEAVEALSFALFGAARGGLVPKLAAGGMIAGYAPGGPVRGPGGPTDDRVLARLSAGEFVVQAAAVRKYGTDFLYALNRGLLPLQLADIRKFAGGGMVGREQQRTTANAFRGELTIGLSDGLIVDQMNTPAGERLVLKLITKNRRSVRNAIG